MRDRMVWRHYSSRKFAGPGWRIVFPELLKGFLQKVGTDSLEVVAQEIAQPEVLVGAEILAAAE